MKCSTKPQHSLGPPKRPRRIEGAINRLKIFPSKMDGAVDRLVTVITG